MSAYPGQRARRGGAIVVIAIVAALGLGIAVGWAIFHRSSGTVKAQAPLCPGSQHDPLERAHAAGCLLDEYLALANVSTSVRDARLDEIVLPDERDKWTYPKLGTAPVNGPGQTAQYAKITTEYATVVAVKPDRSSSAELQYPAPDIPYSAWVSIVDAYESESPPLANWYLGDFAVQWHDGRWWLAAAFHADTHATPMTYTQGPESTAFGPGWVGI